MKGKIIRAIHKTDKALSGTYLKWFQEKPALICFLFHGIFADESEIQREEVDPQQGITVAHFRAFIEYYQQAGYAFVSPKEVAEGLEPGGKYILITFDDGYYSNRLVVPVLQALKVPAIFYISANHVRSGKAFWWDVVYRNRKKEGVGLEEIRAEQESLKGYTNEEIEVYLLDRFGPDALHPVSDLDRAFTADELAAFAREPYVYLGNHTHNHAILTNYDEAGMTREIEAAQKAIFEMTGIWCESIAYPNGNHSAKVVEVCKNQSLQFGITTEHQKNYFPIDFSSDQAFLLNRFTLWGNKEESIEQQCEKFRADPYLRHLLKPLAGR